MITGKKNAIPIRTDSIEDALIELKSGKPVVVLDDQDRENEGDLILPAQFAHPDSINFMAKHARGLICVAMTGEALDRLDIPMMVTGKRQTSRYGSPFTISVESRIGVTTGISASDRARTIQVLADESSRPSDIVMPGHIFPLRAHPDGVLTRRGHTEAGVDLMRLAGLAPSAVICEIMDDDGSMARGESLVEYARKHNLKLITIEDLVAYRLKTETIKKVVRVDSARLPTHFGEFEITAYRDYNGLEHVVLSLGSERLAGDGPETGKGDQVPLVRVHSECLTGDVFGSLRCDCGEQLASAMEKIANEGTGLVVYLRQEGRGIGLVNKIRAYALQDQGLDTVQANVCLGFSPDDRDYSVAAAILTERSIKAIRLMTNNPGKIAGLEAGHINVLERIPIEVAPGPENKFYLSTKRDKMDHALSTNL